MSLTLSLSPPLSVCLSVSLSLSCLSLVSLLCLSCVSLVSLLSLSCLSLVSLLSLSCLSLSPFPPLPICIKINFGDIPNSRSVLFLQIFLKRAAKPNAGNLLNLLNLTWPQDSQNLLRDLLCNLLWNPLNMLNLTWLCTKLPPRPCPETSPEPC